MVRICRMPKLRSRIRRTSFRETFRIEAEAKWQGREGHTGCFDEMLPRWWKVAQLRPKPLTTLRALRWCSLLWRAQGGAAKWRSKCSRLRSRSLRLVRQDPAPTPSKIYWLAEQISVFREECTMHEGAKRILAYVGTYTSKGSEENLHLRVRPGNRRTSAFGDGSRRCESIFSGRPSQWPLSVCCERVGGVRRAAVWQRIGVRDRSGVRPLGKTRQAVERWQRALPRASRRHGSLRVGRQLRLRQRGVLPGRVRRQPWRTDWFRSASRCKRCQPRAAERAARPCDHARSHNRFAYAPDLGLDQVVAYRLDLDSGELIADVPAATLPGGAGPRHIAFHPNGRFAYVINELNSTMSAFEFDNQTGELRLLESVSTLPTDFSAENYCADVHVHPSGIRLRLRTTGTTAL